MKLRVLLACLLLGSTLAVARAEPVTRREAVAAIKVLETDITGPDALKAAETVTRFGKESDAVLIIVGPETMPWVQTDVPEGEAKVRAMLMAAYFAGDIKAQLEKRRAEDDPYRGWLAVIKAYQQIRKKQPRIRIDEVEELIAKEEAGVLKQEADELLKEQQKQQPDNMV